MLEALGEPRANLFGGERKRNGEQHCELVLRDRLITLVVPPHRDIDKFFINLFIDIQRSKQWMLCPIHTERLVQGFHQGLRDRDTLFCQTQFGQKGNHTTVLNQIFLRDLSSWSRKHQVPAQWNRRVELVGIKTIDQFCQSAFFQTAVDFVAELDQSFRQCRMCVRVHHRTQHPPEHDFISAHGFDEVKPPSADFVCVTQVRKTRVQPVGFDAIDAIAGPERLDRLFVPFSRVPKHSLRTGLQRHQEIVAQSAVKEVWP